MHRAGVAILFSATLSVACGRTLAKDDGQWVRAPKDYAATRFSGLTEITTDNVKNLPTV